MMVSIPECVVRKVPIRSTKYWLAGYVNSCEGVNETETASPHRIFLE